MRILDKDNNELESYDLSIGYVTKETIVKKVCPAIPEVKEQGHYETIAEYPNGGKDIQWVVDVEAVKAKEEWTEYEDILRYTPYAQKQIDEKEILELKSYLSSTDYVCNKIVEGVATKEDYAGVLAKRQEARERINELQNNEVSE